MTSVRREIVEIIDRLIVGEMDRESASLWAVKHEDSAPSDPIATEALDLLMIIDAWQVDEYGRPAEYMYDFAELAELRERLVADKMH